ncbi:PKD domain-containing protein [bacterium]|jgi:PKD repeat protein|nr:PKD domain-containing protein [bacterium]
MRQIFWLALCAVFFSGIAIAQDAAVSDLATNLEFENTETAALKNSSEKSEIVQPMRILPEIKFDPFIVPGQEIVFDASGTELLKNEELGDARFWWNFGDGARETYGEVVSHTFSTPGRYEVRLSVRQDPIRTWKTISVTVYTEKAVLVTDTGDDVQQFIEQAGDQGIWLQTIPFSKSETGISADAEFARRLQENLGFFHDAKLIIFKTRSANAFQNFAQWWQKISSETQFSVAEKCWVQISDGSLDQTGKLLQPTFQILEPQSILLTRPEALDLLFQDPHPEVSDQLKMRAIEFQLVDDRATTWLPFSRLVTYFVSHGISQNVLFLLLAVPFVTFVIAFFRQFVGLRTFGVFAPLMLTLSFVLLGLNFGFVVFAVVMVVSYLIRLLFNRVELLYVPRVSLLLSTLSLSFFLVLGLAVYFKSSVNLTLAVFPMLVMATISEKFLSAQSEDGIRSAAIVTGETVLVALLAFFFIEWSWMENAILSIPEFILAPIFGNIWLGKFTGLRLSEYFKFAALFREDNTEE